MTKMLIAFVLLGSVLGINQSCLSEEYCTEDLEQNGVKIRVLHPTYLQPGSIVLITLETALEKNKLKAEFRKNIPNGRYPTLYEIPIIAIGEKKFCLVGIDVRKEDGTYNFLLYQKIENEDWEKILEHPISFQELKTREVPLIGKPPKRPKDFLPRYHRERIILNKTLAKTEPNVLFQIPFTMPLESMVVNDKGEFGVKRVYNPEVVNAHTGVDLKAAEGTGVFAINEGKVILARNFTLEGNFVAIDHGAEIISFYLHLKKLKVQEGKMIKKGEVVGLAGATGSAAGAHLHFALKVNGQTVNPLEFIEIANLFLFPKPAAR